MDRALLAICALLLNAAFGGPRQFYEKTGLLRLLHTPARMLRDVERKLNREHRSPREREIRGWIVVATAILLCLIFGWVGNALFAASSRFFELFLLACILSVRPVWDLAKTVQHSLSAGNINAARQAFEGTPWRHHALFDEHGAARAAIETLAIGFAEKIVSPVIWYLMFGLPGLFVTVGITLLNENIAAGGNEFGKAARAAHYIIHWLPSRLTAGLWILASLFQAEGKVSDTAKQLWTPIMEAGPQMLVLASASQVQKLSLGGPVSIYAGGAWTGAGTPKATQAHVKKAMYLFAILNLLLVIFLGVVL